MERALPSTSTTMRGLSTHLPHLLLLHSRPHRLPHLRRLRNRPHRLPKHHHPQLPSQAAHPPCRHRQTRRCQQHRHQTRRCRQHPRLVHHRHPHLRLCQTRACGSALRCGASTQSGTQTVMQPTVCAATPLHRPQARTLPPHPPSATLCLLRHGPRRILAATPRFQTALRWAAASPSHTSIKLTSTTTFSAVHPVRWTCMAVQGGPMAGIRMVPTTSYAAPTTSSSRTAPFL